MLFHLSNLPYWILLGTGICLFLVVIVSGSGDDDLDFDPEVDAGIDANLIDLDTDAEVGHGFSLEQAVGWLGIGKAPLMLLLATDISLWGLLGWMVNVLLGEMLGATLGSLMMGIVLCGSLVVSLAIGSLVSQPLGKIFASFGEDTSDDRVIGCIGTVSTARIPSVLEGKIGQVDVLDPAHNRVTINAVLPDWATIAPQRGESVLVIERSQRSYLVVARDSPDQDRWLTNSSLSK
jgi:hypothetical protein